VRSGWGPGCRASTGNGGPCQMGTLSLSRYPIRPPSPLGSLSASHPHQPNMGAYRMLTRILCGAAK